MSELGDPAIKLFGRKIPVPETQIPAESLENTNTLCQIPAASGVMDENQDATETPAVDHLISSGKNIASDLDVCEENSYSSSVRLDRASQDYQTLCQDNNTPGVINSVKDQGDVTDSGRQEKVLTKPDKVLPCPRCDSFDTKFCYFNNYNVNQPRHFCKNCQRYWTAGGTMRNVPIGAGRRKHNHKQPSLQHRQCNTAVTANVDIPASNTHQISLDSARVGNGIEGVLAFDKDTPLSDTRVTALNVKGNIRTHNVAPTENGEEPSPSSSAVSNTFQKNHSSNKGSEEDRSACNGFVAHPLQGLSTYPWNPAWNGMVFTPDTSNPNQVQWGSPPVLVPPFCGPTIPFPYVPASHWGCVPGWETSKTLNPQPLSTSCASPSTSASNSGCSGNGSPLGKHARKGDSQSEEKAEKSLWVPKTLRVDDPNEAAKSSIWATLGIKSDMREPIGKGSIFKAFQQNPESSSLTSDTGPPLQANPAALSRSQTFQERT